MRTWFLSHKESFVGLPAVINIDPGIKEMTIDGMSVPALCRELEEVGADVVGLNCALGPDTIMPIMRKVKKACKVNVWSLKNKYSNIIGKFVYCRKTRIVIVKWKMTASLQISWTDEFTVCDRVVNAWVKFIWFHFIYEDCMVASFHMALAKCSGLCNYHPRMWVGNVFGHVCVCVCVCVCVSVFLSVQAITFELLDIENSFLVCRYILTISRSSLSIKVIGSRSRSYEKKW